MKNDNKGFSLIELIVVIAIMAILVGVMAPNVLKYVEQSRVAADTQVIETVRTAVITSLLDPSETIQAAAPTAAFTDKDITTNDAKINGTDAFSVAVQGIMGGSPSDVAGKLKSKAYKGQAILLSVTPATGQVTVKVKGNNGEPDLKVE